MVSEKFAKENYENILLSQIISSINERIISNWLLKLYFRVLYITKNVNKKNS